MKRLQRQERCLFSVMLSLFCFWFVVFDLSMFCSNLACVGALIRPVCYSWLQMVLFKSIVPPSSFLGRPETGITSSNVSLSLANETLMEATLAKKDVSGLCSLVFSSM